MNTEKVEIPIDANTEQFHAKLAEAERQFVGSVEKMNYAVRVNPFDKIAGSLQHMSTSWTTVSDKISQQFHSNLSEMERKASGVTERMNYAVRNRISTVLPGSKVGLDDKATQDFHRNLGEMYLKEAKRVNIDPIKGFEPSGGLSWNWRSAIIGGMLGRLFGGKYAGMGAGLGGGLGGPVGALAGGVIGAGVGTAASIGETVFHGIEAGLQGIVGLTTEAVKASIQLGMEYERLGATFKVFTGSAEAGTQLFGNIQQMALRTPYSTQQLASLGQVLLGYDVPAKEVPDVLSRLGDIAGGDTERFHRLALAFGQVLASGKLLGQERRQFANVGVGLSDFARAANMSESEFLEASRRGEIGANIVIKTLNMLTSEGGRYAGASAAVMNTVSGSWKNLMSVLEQTGAETGIKGFGRLNVADRIGDLANTITFLGRNMDGPFETMIDWFERGARAAEPLVTFLRTIAEFSFNEIGNILGGASTWEEMSISIRGFGVEASVVFAKMTLDIEYIILRTKQFKDVLASGVVGPGGVAAMGGTDVPFIQDLLNTVAGSILANYIAGESSDDETNKRIQDILNRDPRKEMDNLFKQIDEQNAQWRNRLGIVRGVRGAELPGAALFGAAGLSGMGVNIPQGVGKVPEQITVEWSKFEKGLIESIKSETEKGFDPLTKFQETTSALNRLFTGGKAPLGGVVGGMGITKFPGMITEQQLNERAFEAFEQLENAVRSRLEVRLAPAAFAGSSEAQETVNRSMAQNINELNQIQMVLDEANRLHSEHNQKLDKVITALGDKQIIVKKKM